MPFQALQMLCIQTNGTVRASEQSCPHYSLEWYGAGSFVQLPALHQSLEFITFVKLLETIHCQNSRRIDLNRSETKGAH
jgi:hypothetical protein